MNKREFIEQLDYHLDQLPKEERYKHTAYYSELIDDMVEDGMTEEEAVYKIGAPGKIAEQILQQTSFQTLVRSRVKPKKGWTVLSIILIIIGSPVWVPLGLALAGVLLGLAACVIAFVVAIFAAVIGIAAAGVACMVVCFGKGLLPTLVSIGAALALLGLCIIGFLACIYIAKGVFAGCRGFGRWVKSLFIRK